MSVAARTASTILFVLMLATVLAATARPGAAAGEVDRLTGTVLGETPTMNDLHELADRIGGRISGTPACDRAIEWAAAKFREAGVDAVTLEPFTMANGWSPRTIEASALAPPPSPCVWRPRPKPLRHRRAGRSRPASSTPARGAPKRSRSSAKARRAPSRW